MKKILGTYFVARHAPGALHTVAPSLLLYADASRCPREVHWLDLSDGDPKPAAGKRVIHTQNKDIWEMYLIKAGKKQLLIVAAGDEGLFAYNTKTDKLEWEVRGKLLAMKYDISVWGVATDGRGHLFVTDAVNERIHVFSVLDGSYMGSLLTGDDTLDCPSSICWCENMSSLVLVCYLPNGEQQLKVIRVQF